MTGGLLDFFILEAGEYVDRLDGLVSRAVAEPPEADGFARAARALRGSATMARQEAIANVAAGLERLARAVRDRDQPWDHAVRGAAVAAIDDLKILLRRVRDWDAADETRARTRAAELSDLAPKVVTHKPRGRGSAFLAATAAEAATGLLEYAEQPGPPEALEDVMRRVRALRGVAALRDLPPLAEVVDAIDVAAKPIELGHDTATAERRRLFRTAARVLLEGGDAVRRGAVPPIDSPTVREFAFAAERLHGTERETDEVVPIAMLFPDDPPSDAVRAAPHPPTTAAQRFRLEVVSQAEHLQRLVDEGREAVDAASRDRVARELRTAVRGIARSAQSYAALEISNVFLAAERGAAALEPHTLGVLAEAATLLADPSTAAEAMAPRFLDLAATLAGTPASGTPAVRGGEGRRSTPMSTRAIPRRRSITGPGIAPVASRSPTPALGSAAIPPAEPSTEPPSGAALHALLATGIAGLSPLGAERLATPAPMEDDDVVPIEELLLRGRDALERAIEISSALRTAGAPPDPATLDELYDVLQLAAAE